MLVPCQLETIIAAEDTHDRVVKSRCKVALFQFTNIFILVTRFNMLILKIYAFLVHKYILLDVYHRWRDIPDDGLLWKWYAVCWLLEYLRRSSNLWLHSQWSSIITRDHFSARCTCMISEYMSAIENGQVTLMSLSQSLNQDDLTFRSQSSQTKNPPLANLSISFRADTSRKSHQINIPRSITVNWIYARDLSKERLESAARRNEIE